MKTNRGSPAPFGIHFYDGMVNFALHAPHAKACSLCIFSNDGTLEKTYPLDPLTQKSSSIWHISLRSENVINKSYLYLIDHVHYVLDPYAKFVNTSTIWGRGAKAFETKAICKAPDLFDWENTSSPSHAIKDLVIYEMHTRAFTIKADVSHPGTFLGIIEKIPYLKSLGINAIELMPIHEFNECENPHPGLYNFWGYSPICYFSFMNRYGAKDGNTLNEFKTLVKELHKAGIAIIIDVVYNHTAEGGLTGPSYHFKHLDPAYYIRDDQGHLIDYTGCGNTIDSNHNPSFNLILDSLRYLAIDCRVDGFRFDLASTFYRSKDHIIQHPRIIEAICDDPILSKKILIAEAWDAKGLYQVGKFPKPFADWNGAYRDKVRSFINKIADAKGAFADAISGTSSLYFLKTPDLAINFITAHDGFTLHDLFSYNHKHNLANQEHNHDGSDHNISFNWGCEGVTEDAKILAERQKLMQLSYAILMLSLGTPMILMGDEYGHTRLGNNNAYCQDNQLNYFLWDKIDPKMVCFIKELIALRKSVKRLTSSEFFKKDEISWHGPQFREPMWHIDDRFLAYELYDNFIVAINMAEKDKEFFLPNGIWEEVLASDQLEITAKTIQNNTSYFIRPFCLVALRQIQANTIDKANKITL